MEVGDDDVTLQASFIGDDHGIVYSDLVKFLKNTRFAFNASQRNISFPIVGRICKRLKTGHSFGAIQITNNVIVNGHHRYISLCFLDMDCEHVSGGANISAKTEINWSDVFLDEQDHDRPEERERYAFLYDKTETGS